MNKFMIKNKWKLIIRYNHLFNFKQKPLAANYIQLTFCLFNELHKIAEY